MKMMAGLHNPIFIDVGIFNGLCTYRRAPTYLGRGSSSS